MRLFELVLATVLLVAIVVLPLGVALGQEGANATRVLPDIVQRGETFDVIVTFTAPCDEFNSIALRDTAPDGWNATVYVGWCTPWADAVNATGNRASITWNEPYSQGTNFTAMHKVDVPCDASLGNHSFNVSDYESFVSYWRPGVEHRIREPIEGHYEVQVIAPALCNTTSIPPFYAAYGGGNPQDRILQLWSSTSCMLNWTANITGTNVTWLSMSSTNGSCNYTEHSFVNLSVNTSGMDVGNYTANITIEALEARNSPQIIPVGLYIRETGTLQGKVNFTGRAPDKWIEPFVVKLFQPGDFSQPVRTEVATTNSSGVFIIPDVVAGIYDIGIKNWTCLSEVETNVTVGFNETKVVDFGQVREGDADNDDQITLLDLGYVLNTYGTGNPCCDFDRSGYVDLMDLGTVLNAYGWSGDIYEYTH